ncbi:MAG: retropepsin-like aspartic protease [Bacteroidia bacterium]
MKYKINLQLVPLEESGFHLLLKANWNDRSLQLVLDTGASKTVFDKNVITNWFPELELQPVHQTSAGLGTTEMESHVFELKRFQIGDCRIKGVKAAALDLQHIRETYAQLGYGELDGILGGDILHKYRASIHYHKQLLILRDGK